MSASVGNTHGPRPLAARAIKGGALSEAKKQLAEVAEAPLATLAATSGVDLVRQAARRGIARLRARADVFEVREAVAEFAQR